MATPEGAVKKQIRAYLTSLGAYHFSPVQYGMGASTLDLLCCLQGKFIAIEVKRPGVLSPTARQNAVIKTIHAAGGIAFTTDSLERTRKYLQDHALGLYNPEHPV